MQCWFECTVSRSQIRDELETTTMRRMNEYEGSEEVREALDLLQQRVSGIPDVSAHATRPPSGDQREPGGLVRVEGDRGEGPFTVSPVPSPCRYPSSIYIPFAYFVPCDTLVETFSAWYGLRFSTLWQAKMRTTNSELLYSSLSKAKIP